MRIFLDSDVPRQVEDLLKKKGHEVFHAGRLPLTSVPDHLIYVHAVRQKADLIITCNNGRTPEARKGNFARQVEEHLGVREKDFPVRVYGLTQSDTGNNWKKIEQRWPAHERQIEHHARQLEHTDHDKRRARAIEVLTEFLRLKQEQDRQRKHKRGHEFEW
jgi:hypothetical protein